MSQSLPSTLSTQGNDAPQQQDNAAAANPAPVIPAKRGPGRPKGSGKNRIVDPNVPPPVKRPVGRPRKDGLPAGSVPRPANAPPPRRRKTAAPGVFASAGSGKLPQQASGSMSSFSAYPSANFQPAFQSAYSTLSAALLANPMGETASAPVTRSSTNLRQQTIDPSLSNDDWANLSRTSPNALVQSLIAALQSPDPVSRTGFPLEEAFKYHVGALGTNHGVTSYYATVKTFWLPCSPSYFCLTASGSTPTPPDYKFLYWDPQQLVFNGIACPHCSAPLTNRGIIQSGPIKVYDLGKPFYIIGTEYACTSQICNPTSSSDGGRKFASTDPLIMRSLPAILRDELPAQLLELPPEQACAWNWEPMGISKTIWNMVRVGLAAGIDKDTLLLSIRGSMEGILPITMIKRDESASVPVQMPVQAQAQVQDVEMHVQSPSNPNPTDGAAPDTTMNGIQQHQEAEGSNANPDGQTEAGPSNTNVTSVPVPGPNGTSAYIYAQSAPPYMPSYAVPYPYLHQPINLTSNLATTPVPPHGGQLVPISVADSPNKRIRHCCKCGSKDCKGKGGSHHCANKCQDCGEMACKGRNSKRPDKTCVDAWS